MATFDYSAVKATVERLLTKFGSDAVVYSEDETGGEDALGQPLPDKPGQSISGKLTPLLPYSSASQATAYEKENVIAGDMYAYFHSDELASVNMLVDANGQTWRVQSINKLASLEGITLYQKLMLRK